MDAVFISNLALLLGVFTLGVFHSVTFRRADGRSWCPKMLETLISAKIIFLLETLYLCIKLEANSLTNVLYYAFVSAIVTVAGITIIGCVASIFKWLTLSLLGSGRDNAQEAYWMQFADLLFPAVLLVSSPSSKTIPNIVAFAIGTLCAHMYFAFKNIGPVSTKDNAC